MRQATFALAPDHGGLHPADLAAANSAVIERRSIRSYTAFSDGSWALLYAVQGDLDAGRRLLEERTDVHSVAVAETGEHAGLAFVHVDPSPILVSLQAIEQESTLVVRTPIECLPDGGVRMTVLGTDSAIQHAVDRVPDAISVRLESIGSFTGDRIDPVAALPERQQAVLEAALEHGYYAIPRRCTQRALAEALDIAPSTLNEHLQKIETRIVTRVWGERPGKEPITEG